MHEPFNPNSELFHFGIKDMKWGIQRFQTKAGKWTPEGLARRREREGFGEGDEGTGKYTHEQIVNSGNPKLVSKYRSELSTLELRDAVNRINTEQQLDAILQAKKRSNSKFTRAERVMKAAAAAAQTVDGVVTWATHGNGKMIMDSLNGKTRFNRKVTKMIQEGNVEWLLNNLDQMSVSQQKAAFDALGVRFDLQNQGWKYRKWNKNKDKDNSWSGGKKSKQQSGAFPVFGWIE